MGNIYKQKRRWAWGVENLPLVARAFLRPSRIPLGQRIVCLGKLLDTLHGVNIDVLSTGHFPGDDKPKPIAFPDPATVALRGEHFALLPMPRFIELKLASGMVAVHRARDLVDVQDLIRSAGLPASMADQLHPWVRGKFLELWQLAQIRDPF